VTTKKKLLERFLKMPADFHYDEVVRLFSQHGYSEVKTGKTSGSRVRFISKEGTKIIIHKPHPSGIMKRYQLKQIKEVLGL
jgi:hypothetical protein